MWRQLTVILVVIKNGGPTATEKITFTWGEVPLSGTLRWIMSVPDGVLFGCPTLPIYNFRMSLQLLVEHSDTRITNNEPHRNPCSKNIPEWEPSQTISLQVVPNHDWHLIKLKILHLKPCRDLNFCKNSVMVRQYYKVFVLAIHFWTASSA